MATVIGLTGVDIYEDEEWWSTHVAFYVYANGQEIFRWNHNDATVDEFFHEEFTSPEFPVEGTTYLSVEAWTHDDHAWPNSSDYENRLGEAYMTIDPGQTIDQFQLGPTTTDNNNKGISVFGYVHKVADVPQ